MPANDEFVVFYAWQSDRPATQCRNLIRDALDNAATTLNDDADVKKTVRIDQDTQDVPGLCDIPAVIQAKIESCDAFVADLTYVAVTDDGKHCPNPNVLFELGFAFKAVGWEKLICVLNEKYGPRDAQIFDLDHRRFPIGFSYPGDKSRREVVDELSSCFVDALGTILRFSATNNAGHLRAFFSSPSNRSSLLTTLKIDCQCQRVSGQIPDYKGPMSKVDGFPGIVGLQRIEGFNFSHQMNANFYREKAKLLELATLTVPVEFVVENSGSNVLRDVVMRLRLPSQLTVVSDLPPRPERRRRLDISGSAPDISRLIEKEDDEAFRPLISERGDGSTEVQIMFGKIQAKDSRRSTPLFIGGTTCGSFETKCQLFADELAEPIVKELVVDCNTTFYPVSIVDLDHEYKLYEA